MSVGKLKVSVEDVRWGGGPGALFVPSGFPIEGGFGGPGPAPGRPAGVPVGPGGVGVPVPPGGFVAPVGPGGVAGGQGGFAGGMGPGAFVPAGQPGGMGAPGFEPNLILDLHVSPAKEKGNPLLCTVVGRLRAKDDRGKTIETPPELPAHLALEVPGVDYPRGSGRTAVHLNVANKDAKKIKLLAGELLVADTKVQTIPFEGNELHKVSTRRVGGATLRMDKVRTTENGIQVSISISEETRGGDPAGASRGIGGLQGRLRLVLEDSKGNVHEPQATGGGMGFGGGSFVTFGPGGRREVRSGGGSITQAAEFAPLPEGVNLKRVVCLLTTIVGKPQRIAFEFHDLALP